MAKFSEVKDAVERLIQEYENRKNEVKDLIAAAIAADDAAEEVDFDEVVERITNVLDKPFSPSDNG